MHDCTFTGQRPTEVLDYGLHGCPVTAWPPEGGQGAHTLTFASLSLALPLLPRGPLVVRMDDGPGAPGRHPRILCDLRLLASRAGIDTYLWRGHTV